MKEIKWQSVSIYRDGTVYVWNDRGMVIFEKTDRFMSFLMDGIVKAVIEGDRKKKGGGKE